MPRWLLYILVAALNALLITGSIKGLDLYVSLVTEPQWFDATTPERTIRTYNLYPYDGFHLQPDYHHVGPMPWGEFYESFDYQTGDHGFFIDIDLESPPKKSQSEYRIILTGGSGAQGWGAETNEHMLYRVLERRLNTELRPDGIRVRIINLAMGGSLSYQNFIALNRWGHSLDPDMILSYSGANDITVPEATRSNVYNSGFFDLRGLMGTSFFSESPDYTKRLARWFPALIKQTSLGALMRFQAVEEITARDRASYNQSFGLIDLPTMYDPKLEKSVILERIAIPEYIHAFRSIRRDFPDIPLVVVRQVIDWRRVSDTLDMEEDYDHFWASSVEQLDGFGEGGWYFVDLQSHWKHSGFFGPEYREGFVHLDNDNVLLVSDALMPRIRRIIRERIETARADVVVRRVGGGR